MSEQQKQRIFVEGRNCWRVEHADRVAFLIDAASYFAAFYGAVSRAQESVVIVGWDFDSRIQLLRDNREREFPTRLGEFLDAIAAARPGLEIRILNWDFSMIYALDREFFPVYKLDWRSHRRVHFSLDGRHPVGASHHQKIVVVDDKIAFSGGIDLSKNRWDRPEHRPDDPLRVDPLGRRYPPHHDAQIAVDGNAAAALGELVRERWRRATGQELRSPQAKGNDPWPPELDADLEDVNVAIARTMAAYKGYPEVHEVERLYLDAIAAARRFIYIENQYFTSASIGDALMKRLEEKDGPETVVVLPLKRYGWLEESTMGTLRSRLLRRLRGADTFERLRVFFPHVEGLKEGVENVHAKVLVIDDTLARVGSANLNNRSMGLDSECDIAIEAAGEERVEKVIAHLRNRLLGEHLSVSPEEVAKTLQAKNSLIKAVDKLRALNHAHTLKPLPTEIPEWMERVIPESEIVDPERPIDPEELINTFVPEEGRKVGFHYLRGNAIALFVLLGLAGIWHFTDPAFLSDIAQVAKRAAMWFRDGTALFVVPGLFIVGALLFFPVTLLIFACAIVFEPVPAFLFAFIGCHLSAAVTYVVGRKVERDTVRRFGGTAVNRLTRRLGDHGLMAVFNARLAPVAPFTVLNLVAGASQVRFRYFLLATFMGMTPGIVAIVIFGDVLKRAIREPAIGNFAALAAVTLTIGLLAWASGRLLGIAQKPQTNISQPSGRQSS